MHRPLRKSLAFLPGLSWRRCGSSGSQGRVERASIPGCGYQELPLLTANSLGTGQTVHRCSWQPLRLKQALAAARLSGGPRGPAKLRAKWGLI